MIAFAAAILVASASSQAEVEKSDSFREYAKKVAAEYSLSTSTDPSRNLVLRPESLLRWSNPVSDRQAQGEVFLWTDAGCPRAIVAIYQLTNAAGVKEQHEFCSLALGALTAKGVNGDAWSPVNAGVVFKPIPNAEPPGNTPRARLRQMKSLAERFTAEKITRDNVQRQLRLLPQPIFRYETTNPDVLDGGLFAFVEGTDPELLLLIEAQSDGANATWHYAAARMNSVDLRLSCDQQPAWQAPLLSWQETLDRPDKPYTVLRVR